MFSFSDEDIFPFPCPRCGEVIKPSVGELKAATRLRCPECQVMVWYYPETLLRALDDVERAINKFSAISKYDE